MIKPTIFLGADHRGLKLKNDLSKSLEEIGYKIIDCGPIESNMSHDYSDYAQKVAIKVLDADESSIGILVCNSGNGMCIAANRFKAIRGVVCNNIEQAHLARQHNNANIICMGASKINLIEALEIIDTFIKTEFEEGRHLARVEKIDNFCTLKK